MSHAAEVRKSKKAAEEWLAPYIGEAVNRFSRETGFGVVDVKVNMDEVTRYESVRPEFLVTGVELIIEEV